jgi:tRNA-2-methylthio-N6-dimethylallyladenosine synthase
MSKRVIETVANYSNLMPCFFVPFQSGDNYILKMMRRGYTKERFLQIISNIRECIPDAAIIADCIVGFPGETDDQFRQSLTLMEEVCKYPFCI